MTLAHRLSSLHESETAESQTSNLLITNCVKTASAIKVKGKGQILI